MKKRIGVLVMSIVMVFTMTVPSYGIACSNCHNYVSPKYLAIGDSIGVGVKGGGMLTDDAFLSSFNEDRSKNWNIHANEKSYVNKVANAIRANDKSWNATFVSLRAKDYCYLLGLANGVDSIFNATSGFEIGDLGDISSLDFGNLESLSDSWDTISKDFFGWLMYNVFWKDLKSDENVKELKTAIRKADVITVELGSNEISAEAIGDVLCKIMPQILAAANSTKNIKEADSYVALYKDIIKYLSNPYKDTQSKLEAIGADLTRLKTFKASLKDVGTSYNALVKEIVKSAVRATSEYRVYTDRLMKYIRRQNPGAIIIATTVPNPMKGLNISKLLKDLGAGDINIPNIDISLLMKPIVKDMNDFLYRNAEKNHYVIADISKVLLNPDEDDYVFHPNECGYNVIARAIEKAYGQTLMAKIKTKTEETKKVLQDLKMIIEKFM